MNIIRNETWGKLIYEIPDHVFKIYKIKELNEIPYVSEPILLNIDVGFKCNMSCIHCVAKDMDTLLSKNGTSNLIINDSIIKAINTAPFMVIVLTGGEPLLKEYEQIMYDLVENIKGKGIIIDTNGTIFPSDRLIALIKQKKVMVRVSWDTPVPRDECALRKYSKSDFPNDGEYMQRKEQLIVKFEKCGIPLAVQTVLHGKNFSNKALNVFPKKIRQLGIDKWYIQRFIPSHKAKDDVYALDSRMYESRLNALIALAYKEGISCIAKRDRRHNSVFLLVQNGEIYTQSDLIPGIKVRIGNIADEKLSYFDFVSGSEHSLRYYS